MMFASGTFLLTTRRGCSACSEGQFIRKRISLSAVQQPWVGLTHQYAITVSCLQSGYRMSLFSTKQKQQRRCLSTAHSSSSHVHTHPKDNQCCPYMSFYQLSLTIVVCLSLKNLKTETCFSSIIQSHRSAKSCCSTNQLFRIAFAKIVQMCNLITFPHPGFVIYLCFLNSQVWPYEGFH